MEEAAVVISTEIGQHTCLHQGATVDGAIAMCTGVVIDFVGVAELYIALKRASISAELHIYESGGHAYGVRPTELPVTRWPDRMEEWMRRLGLLER